MIKKKKFCCHLDNIPFVYKKIVFDLPLDSA